MRLFQGIRHGSVASACLVMGLVAAVCASCGSKPGGVTPAASSGATSSDSGDDATATQCFGNCSGTTLTQDGSFVTNNGEGGPPSFVSVDADIVTNDCPGPLTATMSSALQSASANSATLKWLYPYDKTVFPGGIAGPVLQWSQTGTPDGVYLHLHSNKFDFKGCYKGTDPPNLKIDDTTWGRAVAQSAGKSDPLTVELSTITGGTASGVISETWTFARGSLAGNVYYNTYGSKLVPGQTTQNGAVIKIEKGQPSAFLYTTGTSLYPLGPCVSCHSLSANGTTLVAQQHAYPSSDPLNGKGSMSFDLTMNSKPSASSPLASDINDDWGFSAVYPDGSFLLTSGESADTTVTPLFPGAAGNNPGMIGPKPSTMYDTKTAATIAFKGLSTPYAMMPMFSTDGLHVVYTEAPAVDAGGSEGHTIVMMDFDLASKTFSNRKQLFHDDTKFPGWPFFTPDAKQVIFTLGNGSNFATELPPVGTLLYAAQLYVVDVATGMSHRLDEASGYDSAGKEYLPFPGRDENLDFYPTINPVSAGGYFWTYFTSRRTYGNLYPGVDGQGAQDIGTKAIWVSAIDIDPAPGADPSHPAFYLPGQELGSGNIRAFAVLAPCSGDGTGCEAGSIAAAARARWESAASRIPARRRTIDARRPSSAAIQAISAWAATADSSRSDGSEPGGARRPAFEVAAGSSPEAALLEELRDERRPPGLGAGAEACRRSRRGSTRRTSRGRLKCGSRCTRSRGPCAGRRPSSSTRKSATRRRESSLATSHRFMYRPEPVGHSTRKRRRSSGGTSAATR